MAGRTCSGSSVWGTFSVSRTMAAIVWWPSGEKCSRSSSHMLRVAQFAAWPTCRRPPRRGAWRAHAGSRCRSPSLPRTVPSTGVWPMSTPVNSTTVAPSRVTIPSSSIELDQGIRIAAGRSRSLPPARDADQVRAQRQRGLDLLVEDLPAAAGPGSPGSRRRSPGGAGQFLGDAVRPAAVPAGLAGSGSPMPSVKESPIATKRGHGCWALPVRRCPVPSSGACPPGKVRLLTASVCAPVRYPRQPPMCRRARSVPRSWSRDLHAATIDPDPRPVHRRREDGEQAAVGGSGGPHIAMIRTIECLDPHRLQDGGRQRVGNDGATWAPFRGDVPRGTNFQDVLEVRVRALVGAGRYQKVASWEAVLCWDSVSGKGTCFRLCGFTPCSNDTRRRSRSDPVTAVASKPASQPVRGSMVTKCPPRSSSATYHSGT